MATWEKWSGRVIRRIMKENEYIKRTMEENQQKQTCDHTENSRHRQYMGINKQ